jgi:hypothetical protein
MRWCRTRPRRRGGCLTVARPAGCACRRLPRSPPSEPRAANCGSFPEVVHSAVLCAAVDRLHVFSGLTHSRGSSSGWDTEAEKGEAQQGGGWRLCEGMVVGCSFVRVPDTFSLPVAGKGKRKAEGPPSDGASLPDVKRRRKTEPAVKVLRMEAEEEK